MRGPRESAVKLVNPVSRRGCDKKVTREEILAMKPGGELDKLVAERVFGWEVVPRPTRLLRDLRAGDVCHPDKVPSFSTKLATAWRVVEELEERFGDKCFWNFDNEREPYDSRLTPREWKVLFVKGRIPASTCYKGLQFCFADTIAEGICKTAVLVMLNNPVGRREGENNGSKGILRG